MHCFGAENVNMSLIFYQFRDQRSTINENALVFEETMKWIYV